MDPFVPTQLFISQDRPRPELLEPVKDQPYPSGKPQSGGLLTSSWRRESKDSAYVALMASVT